MRITPSEPEILQRFIAEVRDVARDFFRPELRVARADFEFIDVDRGEHVVFHDAFADQDRVLEVITIPRHERAKHVASESQFAALRARTVRDDLAFFHMSPLATRIFWLMHVAAFERMNLRT